jgi:hypothetical protein
MELPLLQPPSDMGHTRLAACATEYMWWTHALGLHAVALG